jgi:4-amino-4-deoxy-L-arabinose transferase-like glycosyltransferase
MTDLRRFGVADTALLVLVLALAGGARAGYLIKICDNGHTEGPLRVQDIRPPSPGANGRTELQEIIEGLRTSNHYRSSAAIQNPGELADTARIAPGYPWVVGLLARVVDVGGQDNDRLEAYVRWGQCVLGTLTAGLYFLFARRAFGSRLVAALTGIFCALHPFWVINTAAVDDGVLATFLLSAVLFFGARGVQAGGAFSSLLYGLGLAALALTRAALLPFSVVAFLWFLLRCRSVPRGWLCALLAFLGYANGLTPWAVYNWQRFHEVMPIVESPYADLWEGNHHGATGGPASDADWGAIRQQMSAGVTGGPQGLNRAAASLTRQQTYDWLADKMMTEVERNQVETVNRRLAAGLFFFFGERWFQDHQLADESISKTTPDWLIQTYPGALAGTLLGMLVLGVLGWRWTYGWRLTAMPSSLALMWIPLPYILSHAEALSGPRLPLDGVLLCYSAFAIGCLVPGWSARLLAGYRPPVAAPVRETTGRR